MANVIVNRLRLGWLVAMLFLAACSSNQPSSVTVDGVTDAIDVVVIGPSLPIRIATILTTSGATAPLGLDTLGGIEIALAERRNSLLGHPIELINFDGACSGPGGAAAASDVLEITNVIGIIGTSCSSEAVQALPIISPAGLAMISPSNTAPALTNPAANWLPGYYRTIYNDQDQGRIAALFAYTELGARSASTVHDGSPYADQLQQVFAEQFIALGGTVIVQTTLQLGDVDMTPLVSQLANTPPNVIYMPIFDPEGSLLVSQIRQTAALNNTRIMAADALFGESFIASAGISARDVYLSGADVTGPAYEDFLNTWQATYRAPPAAGFHSFSYDATNILLTAIERSAVQRSDGTLLIGRQALRDAITNTANFNGLTGQLSCSEYGDCGNPGLISIYQITERELGGQWPPLKIWSPESP